MIKIGVSPCFIYPDRERKYYGPKTLSFLENDMANYLTQTDVLPILIPNVTGEKLEQFLSTMDGFVFQGGSDISPESYGEKFLDKEKWPGDPERDAYELKIVEYAFKHKKPMLGICRGMQLLNVYCKGTLYQDIEAQNPEADAHRNAKEYDKNYHEVTVREDSLVAQAYDGQSTLTVNSVHHQAVKDLGKDLIVEAESAEDGIVEAFRHRDCENTFMWGIQWHPEYSATLKDTVVDPAPLLNLFYDEVRKHRT